MTNLRGVARGLFFVGVASFSACALVGYDFDGYSRSDAGGSGGGTTAGQGTGSPASGSGMSGSGGSSTGAGGSGASSSSGSGGSQACLTVADCNDNNKCTTDVCSSGQCGHVPPAVDDANACTTDGCNPLSGQVTHTAIANCCPHSVCIEGVPLSAECVFAGAMINCVPETCGMLAHCCDTWWNIECITAAKGSCTTGTAITCACAHSYCMPGAALAVGCDPCVDAVCKLIPTCCTLMWDAACVAATHSGCNIPLPPDCH